MGCLKCFRSRDGGRGREEKEGGRLEGGEVEKCPTWMRTVLDMEMLNSNIGFSVFPNLFPFGN